MTNAPLIETERLALYGWREDQLEDLVRLHGYPEVSRFLRSDGLSWTREQCETALALWMQLYETRRLGKLRIVRKSDGVFIGRAGFGVYKTGEPEIGYALLPEHWGNGYAYEAASGLRDWIFSETDEPHFIGFADTRNAASLAILARIGMRKTHVETEQGLGTQFHVLNRP